MLDEVVGIECYADTPPLRDTALQIELLEVSEEFRLEGIGTEVARYLAEVHPERRLVAFSEGADEFWASLGWRCHKHRTDPERCQLLYIQPERQETSRSRAHILPTISCIQQVLGGMSRCMF